STPALGSIPDASQITGSSNQLFCLKFLSYIFFWLFSLFSLSKNYPLSLSLGIRPVTCQNLLALYVFHWFEYTVRNRPLSSTMSLEI
ncbi:hypothetical protein F4825DRAFT_423322, partial [Nemania diffusa]